MTRVFHDMKDAVRAFLEVYNPEEPKGYLPVVLVEAGDKLRRALAYWTANDAGLIKTAFEEGMAVGHREASAGRSLPADAWETSVSRKNIGEK